FCGAGGLSLGLMNAGFDVVGAFDINDKAIVTYQRNLSEKSWVLDAKEIDGPTLLGLVRNGGWKCPCKSFNEP
ncbi:MAG: DNA cytosine methyltransferase, partial [Methanomassiliicoccus sp.]